jgi:hypothetical protein
MHDHNPPATGVAVRAERSAPTPAVAASSSPLVPSRYVLLNIAASITGYTIKAMERKIERGDWQEGKEWRRAPDGRICIDLVGYEKWVERQI